MVKMLSVLQAVQMAMGNGLQFWAEKHAIECCQKPTAATSSQPVPDDQALNGQALNEDEAEGSSAPASPYENLIVLDTDDEDGYIDYIDLVTDDDET